MCKEIIHQLAGLRTNLILLYGSPEKPQPSTVGFQPHQRLFGSFSCLVGFDDLGQVFDIGRK